MAVIMPNRILPVRPVFFVTHTETEPQDPLHGKKPLSRFPKMQNAQRPGAKL